MTNPGATGGRDFCGELLDNRYRVESKLGSGGMAIVYLATDERLGRQVVIKVPLEIFLTVAGFRERFAQEIQALIQLDNPFIGKILDRGEVDGLPYAVLQYLAGGSLKDRVDAVGGTLTPEQIKDWMPRVARAVDFIHSREFLHRDIKPGNILFDTDGNVYLADFGIAKVLGDKEFTNLTQTGTLPGTVAYMAPEAGKRGSPGPAYDQYALAVVVYQALSGDLPHEICETPIAGLVQKITENPIPLERVASHLPIGACNAVMKALSGAPDDRFASCSEFAQDFVAGMDTDPASVLITQKIPREALDAMHFGIAEDGPAVAPSQPAEEAEATIITGEQPTEAEAAIVTAEQATEFMAERPVFTSDEPTIITGDRPAVREPEVEELVAKKAASEEPIVAAPDQPVVMPGTDQFARQPSRSRRWQTTKPKFPSWKLPSWQLPRWQLPRWRLPRWQLPRWQLPRWQLPRWQLPRWQLPRWQLPTVSLPRVDISEWRASLTPSREMQRRLLIGAGVTATLVVVIVLVMTFMAGRAARAQQIAALEEAVQNAIDGRDWDIADQQLAAITELAPSNAAAMGWRRIIDDGRRIERTETLREGIAASIVDKDWDAAAAQLLELQEMSSEHPQLETFRQRISAGVGIAPLAVDAGNDASPPAEQPSAEPTAAPQQTTEPQPGPAEDPADEPATEEPQVTDAPDPTADDPPPAEENPPATEEEAEPAPVGETRPPQRISAAPPDYPAVPFALAIEGTVTVQATINIDGDVATATVQDSLDPFLDEAAINAVRQWKYEPALVNGEPHEYPLKATLTFSMPPPSPLAPPDDPQVETARQLDTIRFMTVLVDGIDRFRQSNNAYPEALADLRSVLQAVPETDSWGTPFWYQNLGDEYWLVSFGRDAEPGPAPPSRWALGTAFVVDIRVHSGDFEQNPAAVVPGDPEPPAAVVPGDPEPPAAAVPGDSESPAAVGGIIPVPLTDDMTAPVLEPQSVDDIVVDREVRNTLGLITRRVRVYCLVMDDGSVIDARVLEVDPGISLDSADRSFKESTRQSAIDSWHFSPALRDGEPVPVWFVVTIVYEPGR